MARRSPGGIGQADRRAAGLRSPRGHHAGRGRGLGRRVPARHLAPAAAGNWSRQCGPRLHRHLPAMAEGPGQAMDPLADDHRPGAGDLRRRRQGGHQALRVPGEHRGRQPRPAHPGRPRALPGGPAPRAHRQGGDAPRARQPPGVAPARCPPPPVGAGPAPVSDALPRGLPQAAPAAAPGPGGTRHGPARGPGKPRQVAEPGLPPHHRHLDACGLRITDATAIPAGCVIRDAADAPYLRYYNNKMEREALVPGRR